MPAEVCAFAPLGDKTQNSFRCGSPRRIFYLSRNCLRNTASACLSDKNFKGVVLTMNASLAIQILPKVQGDEEVCRVVDEVMAYIQSTGLHCFVGPCETAVEGDFDTIMEIAKQCHLVAIKAGAPSVSSYLKISYRPEGEVLTIDKKTSRVSPVSWHRLSSLPYCWQSGSSVPIWEWCPNSCCLSHGCSNRLCGGFPCPYDPCPGLATLRPFLGLGTAVILSFVVAFLMDQFRVVREAVYTPADPHPDCPHCGNRAAAGTLAGLWNPAPRWYSLSSPASSP